MVICGLNYYAVLHHCLLSGCYSQTQCPSGTAVCAVKVKIEQNGAADPTALNDAQVRERAAP